MATASSEGGYRNPTPTVDIIIEVSDPSAPDAPPRIVLIKRKNEPHGWALPGGFVDYGETLAAAARREAAEETGLEVELFERLGSYSNPERDPRMHTISAVFLARADREPEAGDDAADTGLFAPDALPSPLVFDHALILEDYARYRDSGVRPPPDR